MSTRSHEMVELMSGRRHPEDHEGPARYPCRSSGCTWRTPNTRPSGPGRCSASTFGPSGASPPSWTSFGTLVMNLSMLGFSHPRWRMRTSRRRATGFTSLTDDVAALADTRSRPGRSPYGRAQSRCTHTGPRPGEISVFETTKGEQARTMQDKAFENHPFPVDRHAAASGSALRIDQEHPEDRIQQSPRSSCPAVPRHTRQQIEHVMRCSVPSRAPLPKTPIPGPRRHPS
jgi:hypothetical protein